MQKMFEKMDKVKETLQQGSTMCPKHQFPILAFTCGFMFDRFNSFTDLFSMLQVLHFLKAQKKINQHIYDHIVSFIYENTHLYEQITDLLEKLLQDSSIQVLIRLQKILQKDKAKGKDKKIKQNAKQNGEDNHKKTVSRQASRNGTMEMPENTIEMDNQSEQTEKYDEQYFKKIEQINKESEALARKLQEEENELAKKGRNQQEVFCDVCYVGLYDEQFIPLESCEHIFHKNCLFECFKSQIAQNKFPLTCPNDQCRSQLVDRDIKQVLNEELRKKYEKHTLKFYADMNGDTISWCPTADCEYMFFFQKEDEARFQCPQCSKQYCLNCRVDWHENMTCKEYQITNTHSADDDAFMKFVKGKKFKQCPKCKFWVEKNQGCDHMTCKCKFQFCYKCGGVYGKCECVQKHQQQMRRRMQQQQARQEKKRARMQKLKKKKQEAPQKATRSRKKR